MCFCRRRTYRRPSPVYGQPFAASEYDFDAGAYPHLRGSRRGLDPGLALFRLPPYYCPDWTAAAKAPTDFINENWAQGRVELGSRALGSPPIESLRR